VIADDVDALGPDGRAVTERLEAIASLGGAHPVHVVMATRRPTAVLTPSLRAKTATAIALRTASESDSLDATGVADAFAIPLDARGMAIVRTGGRLDTVQAALPIADRVPRVRRCGDPLPAARTLAAAARATPDAMRRPPPAPGGPERPAS
jgi:DNA segregation ATPase FtsK/SpoIIIE-like protein